MTKEQKLPADPDGKNDERADAANKSIRFFMTNTGTDRDDALCDLLCNLRHWADREPADFEAQLERANDHYLAETAQPGPLSDF